MKVIDLAVADAPTVAAAAQLAAAVRAAALASFGSSLPQSLSTAASHLDVASLVQDPAVQSAAVPVLQAAAAAAGNSWDATALVSRRCFCIFLQCSQAAAPGCQSLPAAHQQMSGPHGHV